MFICPSDPPKHPHLSSNLHTRSSFVICRLSFVIHRFSLQRIRSVNIPMKMRSRTVTGDNKRQMVNDIHQMPCAFSINVRSFPAKRLLGPLQFRSVAVRLRAKFYKLAEISLRLPLISQCHSSLCRSINPIESVGSIPE